VGLRRSAAIFCIELPSARGISSRRPRGDTLSNYAFESYSCLNNSYCHLDQSALSCYIAVNCSNHCSINLLSVSAYQVNLIRRKYSGGCFVTLFLPLASLSLVRELLVDVFRFFNTAGCVHIQPDNRMYNCLYNRDCTGRLYKRLISVNTALQAIDRYLSAPESNSGQRHTLRSEIRGSSCDCETV